MFTMELPLLCFISLHQTLHQPCTFDLVIWFIVSHASLYLCEGRVLIRSRLYPQCLEPRLGMGEAGEAGLTSAGLDPLCD